MASALHALILVPSSTGLTNYRELIVYISEKGILQVNERYILTRTFSLVIGIAYGMNHLLYQRDWLSFTDVQLSAVDHIFNNYRKGVIKKSARFAYRLTLIFWFSYNILLSRFLVNMAMRLAAEDILYHAPQYGPRWYSIGLALRLFFTAFSIAAFMESVHLLCDQFLSKKMNVTARSVDPNACMASGLKVDGSNTTPESLLTYHAFQELTYLAGHVPGRRVDIFKEATCVPSSWKQISGHCIELLNKAANRIDAASKVPTFAAAVTPTDDSHARLNTTVRRRLPPEQGGAFEADIFRPGKRQNFFDSLKGPSTEEILAQTRIEADKSLADPKSGKRPYLGGSRDRLELVAFRWVSKNLRELVFKYPELQKQLSNIPNPAIFHATEDFQLTVWSFQSLARLVVASYHEDQYGVVQKDIPKILESMLGLLMSLEYFLTYEGRLERFVTTPYSAHVNAQTVVNSRSLALVQALKTAIYQIVITFREQLGEFVLANTYADRLRHFVEFDD
ncbi:nucleoporin protein Ndc1-Nup [Lobosporangium transversale]|uniref:Nucleoporin protein Ndc1-Nup n=1 Tax=Lobosporangium transversale TaxID=64571 RepID=A0A1Y2GKI0_9FUNG|nr:nucleoporin protein Ndc1-Nup [Lobosporangium transversale]ORZ10275.1 nucleoporin protein Ndc1-Nup [Lobosporangium transversale]|eukprot:XP_021879182.1 nucleoporin protein Ndc1-Nup [Lobosporangium transversale]